MKPNYYNDVVSWFFYGFIWIHNTYTSGQLIIIITTSRIHYKETLSWNSRLVTVATRIISTDTDSRALGYRKHYDRLPLK